MSTATRLTTADELLRMPQDGFRYDLIEGELRKMSPPGSIRGVVTVEITIRLGEHVRRNQLGAVFAAETGFRIARDPDTILAPDVSFVRQVRLEKTGLTDQYYPEAPALVVEVISPSDTAEAVDDKMRRWFAAGVEAAWVIYPKGRTVTVFRGLDDIRVLSADDVLDDNSVVPGFSCRVGDLFSALGTK